MPDMAKSSLLEKADREKQWNEIRELKKSLVSSAEILQDYWFDCKPLEMIAKMKVTLAKLEDLATSLPPHEEDE